jgi:hypothetical protein
VVFELVFTDDRELEGSENNTLTHGADNLVAALKSESVPERQILVISMADADRAWGKAVTPESSAALTGISVNNGKLTVRKAWPRL